MASILNDFQLVRMQHLGNEEAKLAITQHGHGCPGADGYLVKDFTSGGNRLDENGVLCRDLSRNLVQVVLRHDHKFGEGAGLAHDAKHRSVRTVALKSS